MNIDIDTAQFGWVGSRISPERAGRIADRTIELLQVMLRQRLHGTADYLLDNLSVPPVNVDATMSDEEIAQRAAEAIVGALALRGMR